MAKWVDEKVLQKYWVENCKKYSLPSRNLKIIKARFNPAFDKYPDVFCTLEDNTEVPAEVEWKTSDFNHDISVLKENKGFIIVFKEDQNFELEQVVVRRDDFENWFNNNSDRLLSESLKEIVTEITERKFPKLWFYYLDAKGKKHFYEKIITRTWGVPKEFRQLDRYRDIQKDDLIAFIGPWYPPRKKGKAISGGRVRLEKFRGDIEKVLVFRVISDYYYDETEVWEKGSHQRWPHRFKFSKEPILELQNIKLRRLSPSTKANLHKLIYSIFWDGNAFSLVDIMSHSEK